MRMLNIKTKSYYYILLMSESRVSQLLRGSRSRHEVIISKELRKASMDYRIQRVKERQANQSLKKLTNQLKYFESLNHRLQKGVLSRKKQLYGAQSVRQRYLGDIKRKQKLEELRLEQINRNKHIALKIKQQRMKRLNAVKRSVLMKEQLGSLCRNEKQKLKDEWHSTSAEELKNNRMRVESIVEFQCNLKDSFIRKKQSSNSEFIRMYKNAIERDSKTIAMRRSRTDQIKQKLKDLTEKTARRMQQMNQIVSSIKKFKPSTPGTRSPLSFNKQKLMKKSRCYTESSSIHDYPTSQDNSIFISHHYHTQH